MNLRLAHAILLGALSLSVGCKEAPVSAQEVVDDLDRYLGKRIRMRAKLRSGARCRVGETVADFKTYCKDCQFCNGPYVIDLGRPVVQTTTTATVADTDEVPKDWPMILGGSHEYKPIRCRGPLNQVDCWPFEVGKEYVLEGLLERHRPPRLMVDGFQPAN